MSPISETIFQQALGLDDSHILYSPLPEGIDQPLHRDVVEAFLALRSAAAREGIDLAIASGYRSYQRQLKIWNDKATGLRPVLDANEKPLDISLLDDTALVFHILRWSALPGGSRHHWGTELDVYDRAAVDADYAVQLTVAEAGSVFAHLHAWLDQHLLSTETGFARPYRQDSGGVSAEPWHLSFSPVAAHFEQVLTPTLLRQQVLASEMALKQNVLAHLDEIFARFIQVPSP